MQAYSDFGVNETRWTMGFVGAKNGAGVYQRIISMIPPHGVYIEPFAGTSAILRHKRPASRSVALDCDPGTIAALDGARSRIPNLELIVGDGLEYLRRLPMGDVAISDVFVYADPPYVRSTRRDPDRDYYGREWTDDDHRKFLAVAVDLPCRVLISGYQSPLYSSVLDPAGWHSTSFVATTHAGPAEEWLWANYPLPPDRLHDYRYIGDDYAERWRIKKRQRSWLKMLRAMPALERRAMLAAVIDANGDAVLNYLQVGGVLGSQSVDPTAPRVDDCGRLTSSLPTG